MDLTFKYYERENANKTNDNFIIEKIKGVIKTNKTAEIEFEVKIYNEASQSGKITLYSLLISVIATLEILVTLWMIRKVGDSQAIANSVKICLLIVF